ncbi:MAG: hypothetical protein OXG38_01760 [Chloroflexi bacterium]|nr:hypothetical protein [Chloroflexota bacterium]
MTTHADHPTDTANELLAAARASLAEGDLMQASAKGWGAAAQMVTAIAEDRGWDHADRGDLYRAVRRLAKELPDQDLRPLFLSANSLEQNSHEDWMTESFVAGGIDDVEQFAAALESHLS